MKVYYETMTQALDRVIATACRANRNIDKIELTRTEWHELLEEQKAHCKYDMIGNCVVYYNGVRLEKMLP